MAQDKICEVNLLKGDVLMTLPNGSSEKITKDSLIFEGVTISTGDSSFIRLAFIDKSVMTIGSNSSVTVTSFTKESPGIISLLQGEIRAQVTKDYMEMEDKNKSKLFIRTKTAALGIRGTDFLVTFSNKLEETKLVTFEGKVAMNKIDSGMRNQNLNQRDLDKLLDRGDRVFVTRGQVSNINRDTQRIGPPQKLDPKILDNLKKSDVPRDRGMNKRDGLPRGNNKGDQFKLNDPKEDRGSGPPKSPAGASEAMNSDMNSSMKTVRPRGNPGGPGGLGSPTGGPPGGRQGQGGASLGPPGAGPADRMKGAPVGRPESANNRPSDDRKKQQPPPR